jgi:hypothetical protein
MNKEYTTTISGGNYTFVVKRSIQSYGDRILGRTYVLGGDYTNCITISYKYSNNNPIEASLPHLLYEPECSVGSTLERGGGSEVMIKTALRHAYSEIPSISVFKFDDMSKIDCLPKNMSISPERKPVKPLNLAYFSIAYHSKTWYELRFNAEMIDKERYANYRMSLSFLTDSAAKLPFERFLEIAQPPVDHIEILKPLYESAETYRDFFNAIPKEKQCDMLYHWLSTFMRHYISSVYSEMGWQINIDTMDKHLSSGGGYTRRNGRNRRQSRKKVHYRIYDYKESHNL